MVCPTLRGRYALFGVVRRTIRRHNTGMSWEGLLAVLIGTALAGALLFIAIAAG